jgi:putative ABC transport system substrate-binding protein
VVKEAEAAARSLRVRLQILEVRDPSELNSAFAAMTRERAEALLVQVDAMFFAQRDRIAELAAKRRLPAMGGFREHVEAGGLIGYGANLPDLFRRLAFYGQDRSNRLPVRQPGR